MCPIKVEYTFMRAIAHHIFATHHNDSMIFWRAILKENFAFNIFITLKKQKI